MLGASLGSNKTPCLVLWLRESWGQTVTAPAPGLFPERHGTGLCRPAEGSPGREEDPGLGLPPPARPVEAVGAGEGGRRGCRSAVQVQGEFWGQGGP